MTTVTNTHPQSGGVLKHWGVIASLFVAAMALGGSQVQIQALAQSRTDQGDAIISNQDAITALLFQLQEIRGDISLEIQQIQNDAKLSNQSQEAQNAAITRALEALLARQ